jgi:hypothetical protein
MLLGCNHPSATFRPTSAYALCKLRNIMILLTYARLWAQFNLNLH